MLIDCDLSALEFRGAAELSRDPAMIREIEEGIDIHLDNAIKHFGDAKYRQDAKILTFRGIYGGGAFAFYADHKMPNFSLRKWEQIFDAFWTKYARLKQWQDENYRLVCKQGYLKSFTGREYIFKRYQNKDGSWSYNRSQVCNFPVQGVCTADVMPLCMLVAYRRLGKLGYFERGVKFINQVHDSIILDAPDELCEEVARHIIGVFRDIPKLVYNYWGYKWIVSMDGEAKIGHTWSDMKKLKI
jgi:DNA polymerase-1